MQKTLFISHSIFLNEEEMNTLTLENKSIETIGISVSTWSDDSEISKEILCRYLITNEMESSQIVDIMPDGYKIYLKDISKFRRLKDSKWIVLKEEGIIDNYTVIHQIIIQTIIDLENTTVYLHWKNNQIPQK
jgi:hypothetical protein